MLVLLRDRTVTRRALCAWLNWGIRGVLIKKKKYDSILILTNTHQYCLLIILVWFYYHIICISLTGMKIWTNCVQSAYGGLYAVLKGCHGGVKVHYFCDNC